MPMIAVDGKLNEVWKQIFLIEGLRSTVGSQKEGGVRQ